MAVFLSPIGNAAQFLTIGGLPLNGGLLTTYQAGTTTPLTTYTTSAGTVANPNPIVLGVDGRTPNEVWLTGGQAYKFVLTDSSSVPIATYDNISGGNDLSTQGTAGAGVVGYSTAQTYPVNTVGSQLKTISNRGLLRVQVNDFVTGGAGTLASPWTGWSTGINFAPYTQYDFEDGVYGYSVSPNFAKDFLCLNGRNGTVFLYSGTGQALIVDAGSASQYNIGLNIGGQAGIRVETTGVGAVGGAYLRGILHSNFNLRFRNVPGICLLEISGVLNNIKAETTGLVVGQSFAPTTLYSDNRRAAGQETSAGTYAFIAENCTSFGVSLNFIVNGKFIGGTSESNAGGYFIDTPCKYNTFIGLDLESNSQPDITCNGSYNNFNGILSTGTVNINGTANNVNGGIFNIFNVAGANNQIGPTAYANNAGAFTNTGTGTVKKSVYNVNTATYDADLLPNKITGLTIGTSGIKMDAAASLTNTATSFVSGGIILRLNEGANLGSPHAFYGTNGGAGNAAATGLSVSASSVTSRAINAGGTVNASGADYAEYEKKRADCGAIAKGDIIGFDENGLLTDKWSLAKTFGIKSTEPSYVGGDVWFNETAPIPPDDDATDDEIAAYTALRNQHDAALEAARATVDRIAYSGKVPVNIQGAKPGDYVDAACGENDKIIGIVSNQQSAKTVGIVRNISADRRPICKVL